jgi:hypothetical protein
MNYLDNIDNYLEETLNDTERSDFKNALKNDTALQDAYLDRLMEREGLRNKIRRAIAEPEYVPQRGYYRYAMAASVVGLVMVGAWVLFSPPPVDPIVNTDRDKTTKDSTRLVFVQDSTKKETERMAAAKDSTRNYENSALQVTADKSFANLCKTETGESQGAASDESDQLLEDAKVALKKGNAQAALKILDSKLLNESNEARWLIAIANLKLDPSLAIEKLKALQTVDDKYGRKAAKLLENFKK